MRKLLIAIQLMISTACFSQQVDTKPYPTSFLKALVPPSSGAMNIPYNLKGISNKLYYFNPLSNSFEPVLTEGLAATLYAPTTGSSNYAPATGSPNYAPITGSVNYIQNTTVLQPSSNSNVSGASRASDFYPRSRIVFTENASITGGQLGNDGSVLGPSKLLQLRLSTGSTVLNGLLLGANAGPIAFSSGTQYTASFGYAGAGLYLNTVGGNNSKYFSLRNDANILVKTIVGGGVNPGSGAGSYSDLILMAGRGTGTNQIGNNLTVSGGYSTGTGTPGDVIMQVGNASAVSDTTMNSTPITAMVVKGGTGKIMVPVAPTDPTGIVRKQELDLKADISSLSTYVDNSSVQSIGGIKTFLSAPIMPGYSSSGRGQNSSLALFVSGADPDATALTNYNRIVSIPSGTANNGFRFRAHSGATAGKDTKATDFIISSTGDRAITFPDKDGTVAMTNDLTQIVEIAGTSQVGAVNTIYIPHNAALTTISLPTTATAGALFSIVGEGAGGWRISQNTGQIIVAVGATTTAGSSGSISSTNANCTVTLRYTNTNKWTISASQGTLTFL